MSESDSFMPDNRSQTRFPCIGIELLYSPVSKQVITDTATRLYHATSHDISLAGIAFDVEHELHIGEYLLVSVKSTDSSAEILKTIVRWCKKIDPPYFRVGVSILSVEKQSEFNTRRYEIVPIENNTGAPSRAYLFCPACRVRCWFVLVGKQDGTPFPSILPLYNCSNCQTTRSIPSLLSYNRPFISED